jgi:hypothetical protein
MESKTKSKIEGQGFIINNIVYTIKDDGRKPAGSLGNGTVGFEDESGEYYTASGRYFYDEAPYFNDVAWAMDN